MIEFSGRMSRVFLKKIQLFFIFFEKTEKTGLNQHPLHLINNLLTIIFWSIPDSTSKKVFSAKFSRLFFFLTRIKIPKKAFLAS